MGRTDATEGGRAITYCLVPREFAARVHEQLRAHFALNPSVEVVVERRLAERREASDRRSAEILPDRRERRRIHGLAGRRVADRRGTQIITSPLAANLPRRLRTYAHRLVFVETILPSAQKLEDDEAARLVIRFQAGDRHAFEELYMRYFNHVFTYLRVLFREDPHLAEDVTQQVFTNALSALDRFERREQPFRAWLFVIVRNLAFNEFARVGRSDLLDPNEMARCHGPASHTDANLDALAWISDRELLMLIERLPLAQRQVLVLRHMLDLSTRDIARILGRTQVDVRMLDSRARRFLAERLTALGRTPSEGGKRLRVRGRVRYVPVARARRYALVR